VRLVVSLLAALLLTPLAASAQVINACVKNGGTIKIVADPTQCSQGDTPLSWNVQGPQGEPGTPGEPGMDGEPGSDAEVLHVFDAMGTDIGLLVSVDGDRVSVRLPNLGVVVALMIPFATLQIGPPTEIRDLVYLTPDCTGPAYMLADDARPGVARFHPGPGLNDWVVVEPGATIEVLTKLADSRDGGIGNPTCQESPNTTRVIPVAFLEPGALDYLGGLVPPLYIGLPPQ
jgi:hypothetical protein